ncbi:hypothetical protein WPS_03700 [Vulcanimicrobium alpinum]|uniref:Uncharacterized protein n=1 Tax=Vulcanimicrobium alpinum TaxID=3016050 RepID=A0AAN1XU16_UNVUL|nr:hypothetical protein [Vulcanimicrobium alpinum]BDE05094.1 hypothetical protein WPS_03700 [Vulcanimicrobium alpinum]
MTILATHFAIVLGAWRLRVRIDIDEPRDERPVRHAETGGANGAATPEPVESRGAWN